MFNQQIKAKILFGWESLNVKPEETTMAHLSEQL